MEGWIGGTEGRIVAAVNRLGESRQRRLTEAEPEAAAIKERMPTLEERLMVIEKRLDTPPQQTQ